ncbi:MAG: acetate--CoA ligase family protein [Beijerinckiaceae bacterium]
MQDILQNFFYPRGILFVGASSDPQKLGGRPLDQTKRLGYKGQVYPVNPGSPDVQGFKSFASIADAPDDADFAVIAVPAKGVEAAVAACAQKGLPLAVILSAGFAEKDAEGEAAQERLVEIARKYGMRLIGPNSMGGMSFETGFSATFTGIGDHTGKDWPKLGNISIASQSGFVGSHLMAALRDRGLGVAKWVATGNQADIDVADCIAHMAADEISKIIVTYIEGTKKPAQLRAALELARANGKPVIALKAGRTDFGATAVASHTASLVGGYDVYETVLRQAGVYPARGVGELVDVTAAFATGRRPRGKTLGIGTGSGGFGIMASDDASDWGFMLPELPQEGKDLVLAANPLATVRNPVDVGSLVPFGAAIEALSRIGKYDSIILTIGHFGLLEHDMPKLLGHLEKAMTAQPEQYFCICGDLSESWREKFQAIGAFYAQDLPGAMRAIAAVRDYAAGPGLEESPSAELQNDLKNIDLAAFAGGELAAKKLAQKIGIRVTQDILAADAEAAAGAMQSIGGPVVLKIASPDIAHKSDAGGVRIGVEGDGAVRAAFTEIVASAKAYAPQARIDGVLVSPLVRGGTEVILGVKRDPVFGAAVMIGLGGIFVEIFGDTALRVPPFGMETVRAMIRELKAWPLLAGARGRKPADLEALAQAIVQLGAFADACGEKFESFEINPLIVLPEGEGAIAVDALLNID